MAANDWWMQHPPIIGRHLLIKEYSPIMYQARKPLGQHFLTDQNVLRHIVQVINLRPDHTYVEIGPGLGALTRHILPLVPELLAIEIDKHIIPLLRKSVPDWAIYKSSQQMCLR